MLWRSFLSLRRTGRLRSAELRAECYYGANVDKPVWKGFKDAHAVVLASMVKIFAAHDLAAHLFRGGEDGGVPVGDLKSLLRFNRFQYQVVRDWPNGECGERFENGDRLVVRHLEALF